VLLFFTDRSRICLGGARSVIVSAAVGLVNVGAWRGLRCQPLGQYRRRHGCERPRWRVQALAIAVLLSIVDVARRSAQPHDAVLGWD
jgi:hypothetical protein